LVASYLETISVVYFVPMTYFYCIVLLVLSPERQKLLTSLLFLNLDTVSK